MRCCNCGEQINPKKKTISSLGFDTGGNMAYCSEKCRMMMESKECPSPKCDNKKMNRIIHEKIIPSRIQSRWICKCGAYVQLEFDLYEE